MRATGRGASIAPEVESGCDTAGGVMPATTAPAKQLETKTRHGQGHCSGAGCGAWWLAARRGTPRGLSCAPCHEGPKWRWGRRSSRLALSGQCAPATMRCCHAAVARGTGTMRAWGPAVCVGGAGQRRAASLQNRGSIAASGPRPVLGQFHVLKEPHGGLPGPHLADTQGTFALLVSGPGL